MRRDYAAIKKRRQAFSLRLIFAKASTITPRQAKYTKREKLFIRRLKIRKICGKVLHPLVIFTNKKVLTSKIFVEVRKESSLNSNVIYG